MEVTSTPSYKPLTVKGSLPLFFIPSILMIINVNLIMRVFDNQGFPFFYNYSFVYGIVPLSLFIIVAVMAYRREGNEMAWEAFKVRYRLPAMRKSDWLWIIGLFIVMNLGLVIFSFTTKPIAKIIHPPSYWPAELNPLKDSNMSGVPDTFLGTSLSGNWTVLFLVLVNIILVSLGEELWWRGYILPRQELQYGDRTWIIHGTLWALFHIFTPWNIFVLLPGTLALSYVAQKRKNNWICIITHGLVDGLLAIIIIFLGIMK